MSKPAYDFRLEDLTPGHRVIGWCFSCRREAEIPLDLIRRNRPHYTKLLWRGGLEGKLRCTSCGNGEGNSMRLIRPE